MPTTLETLLQATVPVFPPNSRCADVAMLEYTSADGTVIRYLERRFLVDPDTLPELGTHEVREGDRLDLLAAKLLGDPELAWRIGDSNRVMHPADAEEPGVTLRITLPVAKRA